MKERKERLLIFKSWLFLKPWCHRTTANAYKNRYWNIKPVCVNLYLYYAIWHARFQRIWEFPRWVFGTVFLLCSHWKIPFQYQFYFISSPGPVRKCSFPPGTYCFGTKKGGGGKGGRGGRRRESLIFLSDLQIQTSLSHIKKNPEIET